MTFHPIPNTAEVDMIYTQANTPCMNRYFVTGAAPWDLSMLATLESDFAAWEADVASLLRNVNVLFTKTLVRDMTSSAGAEIETDHSTPGTLAGLPLPQNVTISLKAQTGVAGRDHRGRTYWIGLVGAEESADAGVIQGSYVASMLTAMNALVAVEFPNTGKLSVVHRKSGGVYLPEGVPHTILSYTAADHFVDSQRRRLPGHNRHR